MITRSRNIAIIPRIFTKSVKTLQFAKLEDSDNDINRIINEALECLLNKTQSVIITIVLPDSFHKNTTNKKTNKIHQAHTFAISRSKNTLLVYDIACDYFYNSKKTYTINYTKIINVLKETRNLEFFQLTYGKNHNFKSTNSDFDGDNICFMYIKELEKHNAIHL